MTLKQMSVNHSEDSSRVVLGFRKKIQVIFKLTGRRCFSPSSEPFVHDSSDTVSINLSLLNNSNNIILTRTEQNLT